MGETSNERRVGERRGKGLSSNQRLNEFLYRFWTRYFHDRPDLDRRKQPDRRILDPPTSGHTRERNPLTLFAFAWGKFCSWFRSNK